MEKIPSKHHNNKSRWGNFVKSALTGVMLAAGSAHAGQTTQETQHHTEQQENKEVATLIKASNALIAQYDLSPDDAILMKSFSQKLAHSMHEMGEDALLVQNKLLRNEVFISKINKICSRASGIEYEVSSPILDKIAELEMKYIALEKNNQKELQNVVTEMANVYLGNTPIRDGLKFTNEDLNLDFEYSMEDSNKRVVVIAHRKNAPQSFVLGLGSITSPQK